MSIVEVKVPDIGDFKEVEVIELLVKVGDTVKVDQSLITVESDKASMEIPSSHAGIVKELKVKIGDKVAEGSLVLIVDSDAAASAPVSAVAPPLQSARRSQRLPLSPALRRQRLLRQWQARQRWRLLRSPCRPAPAACRMDRLRCANSPASWASICLASTVPVPRGGLRTKTCKPM